MNRPHPFLLAVTLALASPASTATDWWFVPAETNQDRSAVVYVERSSMGRLRGTGKVVGQIWNIFRHDQTAEFGPYRSAKLKVRFDCEKREYGSESGTYATAFGGAVYRYREPEPSMAAIPLLSLLEVASTFMCSDGKKPTRALPVYDPVRDSEQRFLQYEREAQGRPEIAP
jgi:hypothetical protein